MSSIQVDAVVAGGGSAACAAAVAAAQSGAERVVMLEKAPPEHAGGNARFSSTGFRLAYGQGENLRRLFPQLTDAEFATFDFGCYTASDFVRTLERMTSGRMDAALAETLAVDSWDAALWMQELGIDWEPWHHYVVVDGKKVFPPGCVVHPVGGGVGQLEAWRRIARSFGIETYYSSKVTGLLGSPRAIAGVEADLDGTPAVFDSERVFLCSGGFQADAAKRARYIGSNADLFKVRGSRYNTGEVIDMALALGARAAGQWQGAHASPIDLDAQPFESGNKANRYDYTYGIVVNRLGKRFFDEAEADHTYTYAKVGWLVSEQPDAIAYEIFDSSANDLLRPMYANARPRTADSLGELAALIGIDPKTFQDTVASYNAAIDTATPYDPALEDGRGTVGLAPPKSNWAAAIERPPFHAYPITGGISFTYGGLAVDSHAQVIGDSGAPIDGLYAVGDIMGLFHFNVPGGAGQARNAVFGRRAGRHAFGKE